MDISVTNGDSSSIWRSPSSLSTSSRNDMRTDASRNNSSASNEQPNVPTPLTIGSTKIAKPLHLQRLEAALDLTLLMRQVQSFIGPNVKLPNPNDNNKQGSGLSSLPNRTMSLSDEPLKPSLKSIKAKSYNLTKVKKSKRWIKNVILDGQLSSDDEDEFKSMTASGLSRASLTKEGKRKKKKEDDMVNDMIKFNNFNRKFKKELEEKELAAASGTFEGPVIPKKYERYSFGVMNNSYLDQPLNPVKKEKKEKVPKQEDESAVVKADSPCKKMKNDELVDVSKIKQEKFDTFPPIDVFSVTHSVSTLSSVPITTTAALLDDIPYDAFLPDEILESESIGSSDHHLHPSQGSTTSTWDVVTSVKTEVKPEVRSDVDSIPSSPSTSIPPFKHTETTTGHSLFKNRRSDRGIDDIFEAGSSLLDNLSPSQRINEFDDEDSSNQSGSQNSSLVSQTMSQPPLRTFSTASGHAMRVSSATISRPCSRLSSSQPDPMPSFKSLTAPPTPTGLTTGLVLGKRPTSGQQSEGGLSKKKRRKPDVEVMMEQRKRLWRVITSRDVPRARSQMLKLQEKFYSNRKMLAESIFNDKPALRSMGAVVEAMSMAAANVVVRPPPTPTVFQKKVDDRNKKGKVINPLPKSEEVSDAIDADAAIVLSEIVRKVVDANENIELEQINADIKRCVNECVDELLSRVCPNK